LNEGEVVGCELVVACCHSPTLLDLVEEPFDQISRAVQIRAEAERVFPIAPWWEIRPGPALADKGSDPIDIVTAASWQN
jgi:hypothetical protein